MTTLQTGERYLMHSDPAEISQTIAAICAHQDCRGGWPGHISNSQDNGHERRQGRRLSAIIPFYLRPLAREGETFVLTSPDSLIAVTRDLSSHGIGFQYDMRLDAPFILAEFDTLQAGPQKLIIEIRWRRRRTRHCYLAGGQVLGVVSETI